MERRLSAILAADVVGYSTLMEQDEAGTFDRLRAHRKELFEPEIEKHHGRIFKLTGDGLFAEFTSVVDAVECAVSLQRGLLERNANVAEDQRMYVRIGINLGEVIVEGDDRLGEGVNIAARLEQLAEPGGICVSGKVSKEVEKKLAFAFEPMGEQKVKNIAEPVQVYKVKLEGPKVRPRPRRFGKTPLGVLAASTIAILLLVVGFGAWRWSSPSVSPLSEKASIAVLPFENIGNDSKWDRFADGVTEDIVTDLSHSKDLFVVARNSTEIYKGKPADIRNVGRELGVHYVLEGSIQPIGDQIRVTAQLIDARTGGHVWSNRYDRPATDLFNVQSDVTEKIAATLTGYEGAVAETERSLVRRKPPGDLTAYETYLLGMEAKHKVTKEGLDEGERLLRKALEIDPQLARAYVGLAYIYEYRIDLGLGASAADNLTKLMEAARNAVRLDANDGETQLVLGHAFAYQGKADQALEQFAKAEALAPHNADLLILIAWFLPQFGQPDRAVELTEKALKLNPNYPYWYNQGLRSIYFFGRQFEKSVKYSKQVTEPFAVDYAYLAAASAMTGDMAGAKAAAAEVARLDPNWSVEKYMSDGGGYPEDVAILLVDGARKAGVVACVPADKLPAVPNLIHLKVCDEERNHEAAG
jgi:TolB-like protein/class 3 adenylate cyclase/Tfp pilus assembly protein PilF